METVILFANDSRGVYIPQYFAEAVKRELVSGVSEEQYTILEEGPYGEFYWDVWDEVLRSAKITTDCKTFSLHQDGDLWLINYDNASEEELDNFFGEW